MSFSNTLENQPTTFEDLIQTYNGNCTNGQVSRSRGKYKSQDLVPTSEEWQSDKSVHEPTTGSQQQHLFQIFFLNADITFHIQ